MLKKIFIGIAVFLTVSLSAAGIIYATNKSLGKNAQPGNNSSCFDNVSCKNSGTGEKNYRNLSGENRNGGGSQYRLQQQDCDEREYCLENQENNCEQNRLQRRGFSVNKDKNQECNCEENCIRNCDQENNPECSGEENCLRNQNMNMNKK